MPSSHRLHQFIAEASADRSATIVLLIANVVERFDLDDAMRAVVSS